MEKPKTSNEIKIFVDCVESMLDREQQGGFRGVQSKSLADLVQMESMSQTSTTLKVTNGPLIGKIWLIGGDLIDAEAGDVKGEEAFKQIMSWRSGTFENLPPDETRERGIFNSVQGLLLDSAQMLDEIAAGEIPGSGGEKEDGGSPLSRLAKQAPGVEFVLTANLAEKKEFEHHACENADQVAKWARDTFNKFSSMGEMLKAGKLNHVVALGPQRNAGMASNEGEVICIGMNSRMKTEQVLDATKKVVVQWVSEKDFWRGQTEARGCQDRPAADGQFYSGFKGQDSHLNPAAIVSRDRREGYRGRCIELLRRGPAGEHTRLGDAISFWRTQDHRP